MEAQRGCGIYRDHTAGMFQGEVWNLSSLPAKIAPLT